MRGTIQTQLGLAGYDGAEVSIVSSASPYTLSVRFGGDDSGIDQPLIAINKVTLTGSPVVTELQRGLVAPGPNATASDATGDTVVVWTSDKASGAPGVYFTLYDATWSQSTPRTSNVTAGNAVPVTNNATASYAAVAMDAMGDFIVTWSQNDNGDWNVYARRYDALGNSLKLYDAITGADHRRGPGQHHRNRRAARIRPWRPTPTATSSSPGRASTRTAAATASTRSATIRTVCLSAAPTSWMSWTSSATRSAASPCRGTTASTTDQDDGVNHVQGHARGNRQRRAEGVARDRRKRQCGRCQRHATSLSDSSASTAAGTSRPLRSSMPRSRAIPARPLW